MEELTEKLEPYLEKYWAKDISSADADYFSIAIRIAIGEFGLYESEMAKDLEIAPSTIERWANCTLRPPLPRTQQDILRYINERI